jgi:hypothetical protein
MAACWACSARQAAGPVDKTWLSPGKIQIGNYSPGHSVKQKITIHNGENAETKFSVYYRVPDYVEEGFTAAPAETGDWIKINENSPSISPLQIKEIEVVLNIPEGSSVPERWEFWIGVKEDKKQSLSTELCSRWLITMKGK